MESIALMSRVEKYFDVHEGITALGDERQYRLSGLYRKIMRYT